MQNCGILDIYLVWFFVFTLSVHYENEINSLPFLFFPIYIVLFNSGVIVDFLLWIFAYFHDVVHHVNSN